MCRKIILLIISAGLFAGCAQLPGSSVLQNRELPSFTAITDVKGAHVSVQSLVFEPANMEAALPDMRDLPIPATLKRDKKAHHYTGIIKNKTNYEVSVPAGDSGSTLTIPPQSWIEYPVWGRRADVTAYHDGKPFYCLKIHVQPKNYAFMCNKYDFMAEIVKPEPRKKPAGKKMKRAIKKRKALKNDGVKAFG